MEPSERTQTVSWIIIGLIVGAILIRGMFTYYWVGSMGMPDWDYGAIKDVPAESPYGVYDKLPNQQHVRGRGGE
jgi:hypothetical protein